MSVYWPEARACRKGPLAIRGRRGRSRGPTRRLAPSAPSSPRSRRKPCNHIRAISPPTPSLLRRGNQSPPLCLGKSHLSHLTSNACGNQTWSIALVSSNRHLRTHAQNFADRRRRHFQFPGNGPNTKPFFLQVPDSFGIRLQCRRSPQLDTAFHGGGKAGVDPLPDYPTLKLCDRHEYSQLKIAGRVLLRSVDPLAAGDQRDLQPVDFI